MKLKYKKIILLIAICMLGTKMVTYSVESQLKINEAKQNKKIIPKKLSHDGNQDTVIYPTTELYDTEAIIDGDIEAMQEGILEKNAYESINELMKNYYTAKLNNTISGFEPLINDTNYIDIKDNGRRTKYIENYENIICYTRQGLLENTFVVYVYHETKFKEIDTVAPGLDRFYIMLGENEEPYIYLGDVDQSTTRFMKETDESEEVLNLVSKVNEKYKKAVAADSKLKEFKLKLEEPVG